MSGRGNPWYIQVDHNIHEKFTWGRRTLNEPASKYFTVIARIQAKDGCEDAVATELHKLVEPSRRDKGCINYDMHVSLESPGLFVFYENWESKAHWEHHMKTEHLQEWRENSVGLVADFELIQLEKIE